MSFHLVVLKTFQTYNRGDVISDAATIAKILAGQQATFVVRVATKGA